MPKEKHQLLLLCASANNPIRSKFSLFVVQVRVCAPRMMSYVGREVFISHLLSVNGPMQRIFSFVRQTGAWCLLLICLDSSPPWWFIFSSELIFIRRPPIDSACLHHSLTMDHRPFRHSIHHPYQSLVDCSLLALLWGMMGAVLSNSNIPT